MQIDSRDNPANRIEQNALTPETTPQEVLQARSNDDSFSYLGHAAFYYDQYPSTAIVLDYALTSSDAELLRACVQDDDPATYWKLFAQHQVTAPQAALKDLGEIRAIVEHANDPLTTAHIEIERLTIMLGEEAGPHQISDSIETIQGSFAELPYHQTQSLQEKTGFLLLENGRYEQVATYNDGLDLVAIMPLYTAHLTGKAPDDKDFNSKTQPFFRRYYPECYARIKGKDLTPEPGSASMDLQALLKADKMLQARYFYRKALFHSHCKPSEKLESALMMAQYDSLPPNHEPPEITALRTGSGSIFTAATAVRCLPFSRQSIEYAMVLSELYYNSDHHSTGRTWDARCEVQETLSFAWRTAARHYEAGMISRDNLLEIFDTLKAANLESRTDISFQRHLHNLWLERNDINPSFRRMNRQKYD